MCTAIFCKKGMAKEQLDAENIPPTSKLIKFNESIMDLSSRGHGIVKVNVMAVKH